MAPYADQILVAQIEEIEIETDLYTTRILLSDLRRATEKNTLPTVWPNRSLEKGLQKSSHEAWQLVLDESDSNQ